MLRLVRSLKRPGAFNATARQCFATDASDIGEIGVISGAPDYTFKRKVLLRLLCVVLAISSASCYAYPASQVGIFAPSRTPSQQGLSKTIEGPGKGPAWKIEFETMAKYGHSIPVSECIAIQ